MHYLPKSWLRLNKNGSSCVHPLHSAVLVIPPQLPSTTSPLADLSTENRMPAGLYGIQSCYNTYGKNVYFSEISSVSREVYSVTPKPDRLNFCEY